MFCKMDMAMYLKQLCVRSLRSKRSCMTSLVNTLRSRNRVFAELYTQTKINYEKQHPPQQRQDRPRAKPVIFQTPRIKTTKKKPPRVCEPVLKKPKRPSAPKQKKPKTTTSVKKIVIKPKMQIHQRKPNAHKDKPSNKQKEDTSSLLQQRRTISCGISYAQQQYNARDTILYVGLHDFLQRERARLEIDIISLAHAIEYTSRKISSACDIEELLHDVVHKLKLA